MVLHENDYTFVTTVFGEDYPLNLTSTMAPSLDDKGVVRMNLDGLFVMPQKQELKSNFKLLGHGFMPDSESYPQREQVWVHQDMLNSLIKKFVGTELVYGDDQVSQLINEMLPEIERSMGKTDVYTRCNISAKNDVNPISIEANTGIMLGKNKPMLMDCQLVANMTSKSQADKAIADIEVELSSTIDFHMTNWIFFLQFPSVTVSKAQLTRSSIPMGQHVYTPVFQGIFSDMQVDFNE